MMEEQWFLAIIDEGQAFEAMSCNNRNVNSLFLWNGLVVKLDKIGPTEMNPR